MLNARVLSLLPDHAVFINTSRGALVDEAALVAEVRRRPLYVLLDVTDPEPAAPDSPLRTVPNILLTPHIAGVTPRSGGVNRPAARAMGRLAIEQVLRFLRREPLEHEVTREMLATHHFPVWRMYERLNRLAPAYSMRANPVSKKGESAFGPGQAYRAMK